MEHDWSTFLPDLIVGLFTGLVVGAVLLIVQSGADARRARADSLFAWESARPVFLSAVCRSWRMNLDGFANIPPSLSEAHAIAAGMPLRLWESHIRPSDETLQYLQAFIQSKHSYESIAHEADDAIEFATTQVAERANVPPELVERVIRARAYGFPDDEAYRMISDFSPAYVPLIEAAVDETLADDRLTAALVRFNEVSTLHREMVVHLRGALDDTGA